MTSSELLRPDGSAQDGPSSMSPTPLVAGASPDVSVVIGVYNGEAYIAETLESILAQEGVTCEIIVVDDGSTDGTGEVVRTFGDKVQYHPTPASGGPSKPRNIGCVRSDV